MYSMSGTSTMMPNTRQGRSQIGNWNAQELHGKNLDGESDSTVWKGGCRSSQGRGVVMNGLARICDDKTAKLG